MRIITALIAAVFCGAALGFGQGPARCTNKTPDGIPCFDSNFGVVVRFSPPIPTEKLVPSPPQAPPLETGQAEAPIRQQAQALNQKNSDASAYSQYWTYGKDGSSVFHDGDDVQRFDASTLQSYATSQAQFASSYEMGASAGNVIGALVNAWVRHHQRMAVLKRENLREQFSEYDNAGLDIMRHVMQDDDIVAADLALLARLDPAEKDTCEEGVTEVLRLKAHTAAEVIDREKMHTEVLAPQNVKHLRKNVALAKQNYQQNLNWVEKADVWTQIVGGTVGYFTSQHMAHPASGQGAVNPQ